MLKFFRILLFLWLVAAIVGIVFFTSLAINGYRSLSWPHVQGILESRSVRFQASKRNASRIQYRYEVAGKNYTSKRESFGVTLKRSEYIIGGPITVYHDPQNPENAVLKPGYSWFNYLVIVMLTLWVFPGTPLAFAGLRKYQKFLLEE